MNRFEALEASLPDTIFADEVVLVALLREASLSIDGLLHSALTNCDAAAIGLGEASQAVHRALVALTPP